MIGEVRWRTLMAGGATVRAGVTGDERHQGGGDLIRGRGMNGHHRLRVKREACLGC